MNPAFLLVTTTVASLEEAQTLARALVEARLAACVQIVQIASIYRWDGAIETAAEHLLLCKAAATDYEAVEAAIRKGHTYDVPEIVAVPILLGAKSYLDWLADSTARP